MSFQRSNQILCFLVAVSFAIIALLPGRPSATAPRTSENYFAKIVEDHVAGNVSLQTSSRRFVRENQTGPVVTTYSMLHFADRSFFEKRQEQLDTNDVVLFECCTPPGTGRRAYSLHKDDEAAWNIATTKLRLQSLGWFAKAFQDREQRFPSSFHDLQARDQRLAAFADSVAKDAWGNGFQFHTTQGALEISSLGNDNAPGGEGENADLLLSEQNEIPSISFDKPLLAELLGLTFQGNAMSHEKPHWRSSDLSIDQVQERLKARGLTDEIASANPWLPMQIMEPLLGLIQRVPDVKNTGKRLFMEVMIEYRPVLPQTSNATDRDQVIIYDRNQVVLDDLRRIIDSEPNVRSVGIIYGGGHMPDLDSRLRALGYREESVEWTDTITARLPKTVLEKSQWEWSRKTILELIGEMKTDADQYMQRGQAARDPEQALAEYHKEQPLREDFVRKNPKNLDGCRWLALCYDRIAQCYRDRKQLDKALEFYQKGEKVRRAVAEREPKDAQLQRDLAFSCGKLALVLMETGQMEKAVELFQQGKDIYQKLTDSDPNNTADRESLTWYTDQIKAAKNNP